MFWLKWGIAQCGLSVLAGAFGAHALKKILTVEYLTVYETAVRYQFFHGVALILVAILMHQYRVNLIRVSQGFALGSILFCGSLYLLVGMNLKFMGAVTPLGGMLWIISWSILFFKACKFKMTV